jgi:hypothetical protein
MSEQGDQEPGQRPGNVRGLIQAGVAVVAVYFIGDGIVGIWPDASSTTRVVIVIAVVLGLVAAGVGALLLVRRDRSG